MRRVNVVLREVLGSAISSDLQDPRIGFVTVTAVDTSPDLRHADVRLVRDGTVVWTGKVGSLRRFKDDVSEVENGQECGVTLDGFADVKVGDILEVFETKQVEQTLG